ncbi:hypothetical protein A2U01_0065641, partial [Trifolium medium]|nr:hypothetical protein [Trifolium medium]
MEDLVSYRDTDLQDFNGAVNPPWGFVDLLVTFGDGETTSLK